MYTWISMAESIKTLTINCIVLMPANKCIIRYQAGCKERVEGTGSTTEAVTHNTVRTIYV